MIGGEDSGLGQAGARSVGYLRVFTDAYNVTRFADLDHSTVPVAFAQPAPPVFATAALAADSVVFLSFPRAGRVRRTRARPASSSSSCPARRSAPPVGTSVGSVRAPSS
jgi:hypothetical protein